MILTIFGYPKSGKTLLFNLLTDKHEEVSKFSASANEFHKALVEVPDQRLAKLSELFGPAPTYARIEFLDTGALAFGDSKSSTTFMDLVRRADGLVHMVRGFEDEEIPHPAGSIDPVRDIGNMEDELRTVDFLSVEKRLERLKVDVMKMKSQELVEELELMTALKDWLEEGKPMREFPFTPAQEIKARGFKFLSHKPLFNIVNADENTYKNYLKLEKGPENNSATRVFCAQIEQELLELDEEDRAVFQEEYGLGDYRYMRESFVKISYELMNLISFFTVGPKEVRAWTVNKGDNAYAAAGKIHSDIQKGFIRSETIAWDELLEAGGLNQAKEKGLLRLEGKEYIAKDGEIMHFRFNK